MTTQACDRCAQPFPLADIHLLTSENLPLYFGRLCGACQRQLRHERRDLIDVGDLETIEHGGDHTA